MDQQITDISAIREARELQAGLVLETPLLRSSSFSRLTGRDVFLKAECLQRTGSFKVRGAANVVSRLDDGQRSAGVVAASAGNHAQGVALAAQDHRVPATVFMPRGAAIPKIKACQDYGARVELVGAGLQDAVSAALTFGEETGSRFIHPYDDAHVIAGQGTLGLEILEQVPEPGTVIVPIGGGGLISGVGAAIKAESPQTSVVGVEIAAAAAYRASWDAGKPVNLEPSATVADGINVVTPSDLCFGHTRQFVDEILVVDDAQTTAALTLILERSKLMVEPAGAVGVAALLEKLIPDSAQDPIVIVLSGGNIDLLLLGKVVRHGLEASGRYADFRVRILDQPGQLVKVLTAVAEVGGNVVHVDHHREGFGLPFGLVEIDISVETRGRDETEIIKRAIERHSEGP